MKQKRKGDRKNQEGKKKKLERKRTRKQKYIRTVKRVDLTNGSKRKFSEKTHNTGE